MIIIQETESGPDRILQSLRTRTMSAGKVETVSDFNGTDKVRYRRTQDEGRKLFERN